MGIQGREGGGGGMEEGIGGEGRECVCGGGDDDFTRETPIRRSPPCAGHSSRLMVLT